MNKENFELIGKIADRAKEMNLFMFDRFSFIMDMESATEQFNLRLNELLNADNFNFAHDVVGIQNNINRKTGKVENCFLPRFSDIKM